MPSTQSFSLGPPFTPSDPTHCLGGNHKKLCGERSAAISSFGIVRLVTSEQLGFLQSSTIFLMLVARGPQILTNFKVFHLNVRLDATWCFHSFLLCLQFLAKIYGSAGIYYAPDEFCWRVCSGLHHFAGGKITTLKQIPWLHHACR